MAKILRASITVIYIADNWFQTYLDAIPGAYYDANNTGLIVIPFESVPSLQPFTFYIAGMYTRTILEPRLTRVYCTDQPFTLNAEAQLLPVDQNTAWGAEPHLQYGYIGPIGSPSGEGLDFIIGQKFMERFYAVSHSGLSSWDSHSVRCRYSTRPTRA